jgi:predicted dehydrogenase
MNKINWGIIGLGDIALKFSNAFDKMQNARLVAVASMDGSKLKKFSERFNIKKEFQFDKYEDLLNCDEVDIVYIALPNSLHKGWVLQALKKKKNVLVEKPAVINFAEANEIKDYLNSTNLFFSEAFMYRYHPQINSVINIIKDNTIGNLLSMKSFFGVNILTKKKLYFFNKKKKIDPKSRLFNKELGGGCILDLGCYPSSFSLLIGSLVGNVSKDNLRLHNVVKQIGETEVDIDSSAELLFQGGFKSKIFASFKNNLGSGSVIIGEKGTIILNNTWTGGDIILKIKNNNDKIIKHDSNKNVYVYQINEISQRLLNGTNSSSFPVMSLNETLTNMKVVENWLNY